MDAITLRYRLKVVEKRSQLRDQQEEEQRWKSFIIKRMKNNKRAIASAVSTSAATAKSAAVGGAATAKSAAVGAAIGAAKGLNRSSTAAKGALHIPIERSLRRSHSARNTRRISDSTFGSTSDDRSSAAFDSSRSLDPSNPKKGWFGQKSRMEQPASDSVSMKRLSKLEKKSPWPPGAVFGAEGSSTEAIASQVDHLSGENLDDLSEEDLQKILIVRKIILKQRMANISEKRQTEDRKELSDTLLTRRRHSLQNTLPVHLKLRNNPEPKYLGNGAWMISSYYHGLLVLTKDEHGGAMFVLIGPPQLNSTLYKAVRALENTYGADLRLIVCPSAHFFKHERLWMKHFPLASCHFVVGRISVKKRRQIAKLKRYVMLDRDNPKVPTLTDRGEFEIIPVRGMANKRTARAFQSTEIVVYHHASKTLYFAKHLLCPTGGLMEATQAAFTKTGMEVGLTHQEAETATSIVSHLWQSTIPEEGRFRLDKSSMRCVDKNEFKRTVSDVLALHTTHVVFSKGPTPLVRDEDYYGITTVQKALLHAYTHVLNMSSWEEHRAKTQHTVEAHAWGGFLHAAQAPSAVISSAVQIGERASQRWAGASPATKAAEAVSCPAAAQMDTAAEATTRAAAPAPSRAAERDVSNAPCGGAAKSSSTQSRTSPLMWTHVVTNVANGPIEASTSSSRSASPPMGFLRRASKGFKSFFFAAEAPDDTHEDDPPAPQSSSRGSPLTE